jgi:hypothetical protein
MSNQVYIDFLNTIKTSNSSKITYNTALIGGIEDAITELENQITSLNTQKTTVETENTTLTANNTMLDSIIALL